MPQLGIVDVDQPETLDARRVDHCAAFGQRVHRRKGRRVPSLVVAFGDFARTDVQRGVDGADERRFSDARIARNEGRTPFEQLVYRTDTFARVQSLFNIFDMIITSIFSFNNI